MLACASSFVGTSTAQTTRSAIDRVATLARLRSKALTRAFGPTQGAGQSRCSKVSNSQTRPPMLRPHATESRAACPGLRAAGSDVRWDGDLSVDPHDVSPVRVV